MKKTITLYGITVVMLLIGYACYEPDYDEITDRHCSFYRPDYTTVEIALEYKYFDNAPPVQTAVIKLFNWSPDGKLIVNDLDGGRLLINGQETEFKDSLKVEGFYLKNKRFLLQPGKDYIITLEHDTNSYEFETSVPKKFDDFGIPEMVNMASDLNLQLNSATSYYGESTLYLIAHNPVNKADSLILLKNEVYSGDAISIPFPQMAPALMGWEAELYFRRIDKGSYDLSFINDSKVSGTCSYYKKFGLSYSKGNE